MDPSPFQDPSNPALADLVTERLHHIDPVIPVRRKNNNKLEIYERKFYLGDESGLRYLVVNNPGRELEIIDEYIKSYIHPYQTNLIQPSWEHNEQLILPRIIPSGEIDIERGKMPVHLEFVPGLSVVFIQHYSTFLRTVLPEHMTSWGQTPESLYQVSLRNLYRYSDGFPVITCGTFAVYGDNGFLSAPKILSHRNRDWLQEILGENCVFGLPRAGLIYACRDDRARPSAQIQRLEKIAKEEFRRGPMAISTLLFQLSRKKVRIFRG